MLEIKGMKMYTTAETAEILQMKLPNLRKHLSKGYIDSIKIGRNYYISADAIKDFANNERKEK